MTHGSLIASRAWLASALLAGLGFISNASADAVLTVMPSTSSVSLGGGFHVDVAITGAVDLYGFQFDLNFDPAVVSAGSSSEGPFLASAGSTFFLPGTNDNVAGVVSAIANTLLTAISGASGDGVLASFEFSGLGAGTSVLSLANVTLLDSAVNPIAFTTVDGSVTVSAVPLPAAWVLAIFAGGVLAPMSRRRAIPRDARFA